MKTRAKILYLALGLIILSLLPISLIIAECNRWITLCVVCICFWIVFAISLKFYGLIIRVYHIIWSVTKKKFLEWGGGYCYQSKNCVYPLASKEQCSRIKDAVKITFTGDLILLREMVERAYNTDTNQYEFDCMFKHVRDIWKGSDLAIGVLEGPLCGAEYGYSTSNYDDNTPLALNFPDSFAKAIKDAGIDLVSLSNNHIFDMGIECGLRTPKVLDEIGLDYVGLSTDVSSYHTPKIVNLCGKRIGILAYTYAQNGRGDEFFFGKTPNYYLKPVLTTCSKYFKKNVELVKADFKKMKAANPDLIIVLPHMGEQFLSKPDRTQRKWCKIFADLGADIIFADHPHHVQPIEWLTNKYGKRVLTVYCPGNFINSYVELDGDASMIVSAYLDKKTFSPFAVSITPIYAYCPQQGMWTGLPTYKAYTDKDIYKSLSRSDFRRISKINRLVTGIALGTPLDIDASQREYISFADTGFVRQMPAPIDIAGVQGDSSLIKEIEKSSSICFLGDSVTDGTKNGGWGWYEPLMANFPDKKVYRFAEGGQTSKWLLMNIDRIADIEAELYVVAIGCNDIRYRNQKICAMTSEEFIYCLDKLANRIRQKYHKSRFVFIAPWRSLHFDPYFNVKLHSERMQIYKEYTCRLLDFCQKNDYLFLDPNPLIFQDMTSTATRLYNSNEILKDWIHPNANAGIAAYSMAAVLCSKFNGLQKQSSQVAS